MKYLLLCFLVSNCLNLSHHYAVGEVHKYLQKTLRYMQINDCSQPCFLRGQLYPDLFELIRQPSYIIVCLYLGLFSKLNIEQHTSLNKPLPILAWIVQLVWPEADVGITSWQNLQNIHLTFYQFVTTW